MQGQNEIVLETLDSVAVLNIRGDITVASEPFLKKAYHDANSRGARGILLKFEQDSYINSGGIAVLIQLLSETGRNSQQVSITGLSDHFRKIFNMVGISRFAEIHGSPDEALKALQADA